MSRPLVSLSCLILFGAATALPAADPRPATMVATAAAGVAKFQITDEQRRFWSFQPVKPAPPPTVTDVRWPRAGLDHFILAGLEVKGLRPATQTDKRTLIRRVTFDLIG